MCRITRSRPFMDTHVFLPTICLSALHSFVSVLHAYLQIFRIRWKSKKIQTQHRLVLTPPRSICCFWSRLYWTSSVYLAHTLLFLCNNNTAVPGSSCSQRSGAASVEENEHGLGLVSRATMWCSWVFFFFVYLEKEECHIHLALHCQHRSLPRELAGTMRCSEDGCLSLRHPTHAIHVQRRPRCEPAEVKTHDF